MTTMQSQAKRPRAARGRDLRPYLPATLLNSAAGHESPTWWEWLEGSMMHCDISGFTAMSERLGNLGHEGAELMVGVLNRFFDSMLRIASSYGGVQMKFGGDAMLLYFGGEESAERAAACGLAMQEAMAPFAQFNAGGQDHSLRMRAGITSGRFFSASAGDPDGLLHYVLAGKDVSDSVIIEEQAGLGEVLASNTASKQMHGELMRAGEGAWRVAAAEAAETAPIDARSDPRLLERFLSAPVRNGIAAGPAEHRRVTSMFISAYGIDELTRKGAEDRALEAISTLVSIVNSALERHGGYFLGSDVADKGTKFIGLFGAPVASVGQEAAALHCALDVRRELKDSGSPIKVKIGINTAYVFAGEVGWRYRREYTVIGDGVNLAARLMAAAKMGEVLVSRTVADSAGGSFVVQNVRPVTVKGKSKPIAVCRLVGENRDSMRGPETPMVGRERQLAVLLRSLEALDDGSSRYIHVYGEPGIGKTRLLEEFHERARQSGVRVERLGFEQHQRGTPFGGWRTMLAGHRVDGGTNTLRELDELDGEADPRVRREAAISVLAEHVRAMSPALLLVEDAYWADESSLSAIERVIAAGMRGLVVCITSRNPPSSEAQPDRLIELKELPQGAAIRLVETLDPDAEDASALVGRARGNPLFLLEMVRARELKSAVPDTLNDLMTARIDALNPAERQILRVAAIAGQSFTTDFVSQLAGRAEGKQAAAILPLLERQGFTSSGGDGESYSFTHSLLSEVAYEGSSFAFRRKVHSRAGYLLEGQHRPREASIAETLLHHFERAGNTGKSVKYATVAGDRSAGVFANAEALGFFDRGVAAAAGYESDVSALLERKADVLEVSGRHREAAEAFEAALRAAQAAGWARARFAGRMVSGMRREPHLCQRIAVATEHASDYDGALNWLDRASQAMPPHDARLRVRVMATKCGIQFRKGLYPEAIELGKRAIRAAGSGADPAQVAYAQNMTGLALAEAGQLKEGARYLRRAVKSYHEARDFSGQASANSNLGSTYQLLGMYDAALYHYSVALTADGRTGDEIDAAITHNNMAESLLLLDREDEALSRLEDVLKTAANEPDLTDLEGWAHVAIARCLRAKGDLDAAAEHLARGLRLLRAVGSTGLLTEAQVDWAEEALAEGDAKLGLRRANRALKQAEEIDSRLAEARAQRVAGECLVAMGRMEDSEARLAAAVAACRRVAAEHEEAHASMALGRLYLVNGRRGGARRLTRRAHRIFTRAGSTRQVEAAAALVREAEA